MPALAAPTQAWTGGGPGPPALNWYHQVIQHRLLRPQQRQLAGTLGGFQESPGKYRFPSDTGLGDVRPEPQVLAIHAGQLAAGSDCVSIGPQMHDIHTSREKLDVASTERTWRFLLEVLKAL